jgi:hypothetical protein
VLADHGCEYLTLADTNGTATPARVLEVLDAVGNALEDVFAKLLSRRP